MRYKIAIILFVSFIFQDTLWAEIRSNMMMDLSSSQVSVSGASQGFAWSAFEAEVEWGWKKKRYFPSGIAVGARKEGSRIMEGTYLSFRVFKKVEIKKLKKVDLYPSLSIKYGLPGALFNRVLEVRGERARIFPARNIGVPRYGVKGAGILYPELSIAARINYKRLNFDPVFGVKIMRFGVVYRDQLSYRTVLSPFIGMRIGFRLKK
jgi:hypothetical protein